MAAKELSKAGAVTLTEDGFGTVKNPLTGAVEQVKRFTWTNASGMSAQVISYGATITSIKVPGKDGSVSDVVLGFDDIPGYQATRSLYFGSTIGRVANRIGGGKLTVEGVEYQVSKNYQDRYQLHGGINGFDQYNWISHVVGTAVTMTHTSMDGNEGFPGTVLVSVTYDLTNDNRFVYKYQATSSKPTPINLTNHAYFNLAGHGTGYEEIYRHIISVNADRIVETDEAQIPTGKFICVGGTPYDLRIPTELGPAMTKPARKGYDDNFCITKGTEQQLTFAARVVHPHSGRVMEFYTNQPGVQFYTGNNMPDPNRNIQAKTINAPDYYKVPHPELVVDPKSTDPPIIGKGGAKYLKHGAFCVETQNYPDAVKYKNFPNSILIPGEIYSHDVVYKFGLYTEN